MSLARYQQKRDFKATPEPRGRVGKRKAAGLAFVIQKHAASHLHYDFRLELDGVLLSWAVPKGPSLDPADRRLAMHVEDHPVEYGGFEGTIPKGQYGGGTVMLWDRGTWTPRGDAARDYAAGHLKFDLDGEKLKGGFMLVRSHGGKYGGKYGGKRAGDVWFLIKERDAFARPGASIVDEAPDSVSTGRSIREIGGDTQARVWQSNRSVKDNVEAGAVAPAAKRANGKASRAPAPTASAGTGALPDGARRAALPATLSPMLATLVKSTPVGDGWLHEVKYDGYRMLARVERGRARLYSRNGREWTAVLPEIAAELASLPLRAGWIDGEIAIADARGRTSFQKLQNELGTGDAGRITYFVFDLPYCNGYDLRAAPLVQRKALLRALLDPPPPHLRYGVEIEAEGAKVFAQACSLGLEGIVSKRADSHYASLRGRDWIKVKCGHRQEMVIVGFTDPGGSRTGFGALLLGVHDAKGVLRYAGRVGTGFDDATLAAMARRLRKLEVASPAVADPPRGAQARGVHWVKPELVGEVAYTEWTDAGTLRHPSFLGLREDKAAREVVRERPATAPDVADHGEDAGAGAGDRSPPPRKAARNAAGPGSASRGRKRAAAKSSSRTATAAKSPTQGSDGTIEGVRFTHPDKLLFPDVGVSKRDVALHYAKVAPRLLPHIAGRPLSLVRCPDGWQGECFYQKHAPASLDAAVSRVEVDESDGKATYAEAHGVEALVGLAQWGVIEIHPWGSRVPKLDRPDRLIFDFDPDAGVAWPDIVDAVRALRGMLEEIGLVPFLKTTGGKGLHVVTPIRPSVDWTAAKGFTRAVAELMVRASPERFIATATKARRSGRIFIDYLRNAQGATAIAPYALRARAGAPVSVPLAWNELDAARDVRGAHFNLRNLEARLRETRVDPWEGMAAAAVTLTAAMRKRVA